MGIDSNVNNVSKVFGDYKTNSSSTTSSINSSIVDAVEDVAQSFIDHLKEQIEEIK